jgi:hypothetical protein
LSISVVLIGSVGMLALGAAPGPIPGGPLTPGGPLPFGGPLPPGGPLGRPGKLLTNSSRLMAPSPFLSAEFNTARIGGGRILGFGNSLAVN